MARYNRWMNERLYALRRRSSRRGAQARPRRVLRLDPPHAQPPPVGRSDVARPLHRRAVHRAGVRRRHVRGFRGARARARDAPTARCWTGRATLTPSWLDGHAALHEQGRRPHARAAACARRDASLQPRDASPRPADDAAASRRATIPAPPTCRGCPGSCGSSTAVPRRSALGSVFLLALGARMRRVVDLREAWKSRCVYTCVLAIDAWPSISCTARRSPDDCSTCDANEWRSMCGCTWRSSPCLTAHAASRRSIVRGEMRLPARADEQRACVRVASVRALREPRANRLARRGADRHDRAPWRPCPSTRTSPSRGRRDRHRARRARTGAGPTNTRARTARGRARSSGSSPSIVDQPHGFVGRSAPTGSRFAAFGALSPAQGLSRERRGRDPAAKSIERAPRGEHPREASSRQPAAVQASRDRARARARVSCATAVSRRRAARAARRRAGTRRACARARGEVRRRTRRDAPRSRAMAAARSSVAHALRIATFGDVYAGGRKRAVATLASSARRVWYSVPMPGWKRSGSGLPSAEQAERLRGAQRQERERLQRSSPSSNQSRDSNAATGPQYGCAELVGVFADLRRTSPRARAGTTAPAPCPRAARPPAARRSPPSGCDRARRAWSRGRAPRTARASSGAAFSLIWSFSVP